MVVIHYIMRIPNLSFHVDEYVSSHSGKENVVHQKTSCVLCVNKMFFATMRHGNMERTERKIH